MTSRKDETITSGGAPLAPPARRTAGGLPAIRRGAFAMAVLLLVQYVIGMGVNLFVTLPRQDQNAGLGRIIANGPAAVTIHALLGMALIVIAPAVIGLAAAVRRGGLLALSIVGLLALGSAAFNGLSFARTGQNSASYSMGLAWAVAVLCYLTMLFRTGVRRPGQH
jgi:hypothetical protein